MINFIIKYTNILWGVLPTEDDCTIINKELQDVLTYVYNAILIVVPIIVVALSTIDMARAAIAQDDKDMKAAASKGIPCLIQEQNSFAGKTNKILGKVARKICVAYEGMERFFPADRIMMTGNPVRQALLETTVSREDAIRSFGLDPSKKTILFVGGSLGARTVNESILRHLDELKKADCNDLQVIWQTGRYYSAQIAEELKQAGQPENLVVTDFISDMGAAYRAADLVVSRAGASSISEFCLIGKPVILVPSPNVAEDHQTKNAMALVEKDAALYVRDADAPDTLLQLAISTVRDDARLNELNEKPGDTERGAGGFGSTGV